MVTINSIYDHACALCYDEFLEKAPADPDRTCLDIYKLQLVVSSDLG